MKNGTTRKKILETQYTNQLSGIYNILNKITKRSRFNPQLNQKDKFKDLYSLLYKKELLIQALGNIEKNKGRLTRGVSKSTIDGTSLARIEKIAQEIKDGTYKFQPVLRIEVPKPKLLKPGEIPKKKTTGFTNLWG